MSKTIGWDWSGQSVGLSGDVHVRFCEGLGVRFPRATRLVCFGLDHLHYIGQTYVAFHNHHRPHQGLGNRVPAPRDRPSPLPSLSNATPPAAVGCRQRLGGLLKSYYVRAA